MLNISKLKENNLKKNIIINQGDTFNESKDHPSSTKEWYNSIYNFNKNYQKNIPSIDITVLKAIKNYFNMFSSRLEKSISMHRISLRRRRLKLNRVLIGKPEFKHTNDKVIITLYVYNRELSLLNLKLKKLKRILLSQYFFKVFTNKKLIVDRILYAKHIANNIHKFGKLIEKLQLKKNSLFNKLESSKLKREKTFIFIINNHKILKLISGPWSSLKLNFNILRKKGLERVGKSVSIFENKLFKNNKFKYLLDMRKSKYKKKFKPMLNMHILKNISLNINDSIFLSSISFFKYLNFKYLNKYLSTFINEYNHSISKIAFFKVLKRMILKMRLYARLNRIIRFNKFKFNIFLNPLKLYLENIYKKDVEFNIISLKSYHLDSYLLTQVISTKLRNRKVRVTALVKRVLSKIKLPISKKHEYSRKIIRNKNIQNIIVRQLLNKKFLFKFPILNVYDLDKRIIDKRTDVNSKDLLYIYNSNDTLNNIIKWSFPSENTLKKETIKTLYKRNLENVVLDTIKNKFVSGIRIESSGRLTKRIIAARSISFVKQKGTIRNINSSYKKIPSLLLKGNFKSNLQVSKAKNRTRIGSFGLKGWVNSI